MRLLACLVLTTLLASAFAQYGSSVPSKSSVIQLYPSPYKQLSRSAIQDYRAQIEAVNALPNVEVQVINDEGMFRDDVAMETESTDSVVDPSSVIVDAVSDAVETVAASLSQDAEVSKDEAVVVEEEVQEDPAPTLEVIEEEVAEADETMPEEDEPMLQPVAVETQAPEVAMEDVEPTLELHTSSMSVAEPEPEPAPEDKTKDEQFAVEEPEQVVPMEEEVDVVEEPREPTKKELQAIEKYNGAVDNIVNILNKRLTQKDALPLELDEDVLRELEVEVTTLPPTTLPPTTLPPIIVTEAASECSERRKTKCASEKCKKKAKCQEKCKAKGCLAKKKNKKNKNRKGDDKNKKTNKNKNNKKKNNNKSNNNKNKRKNKNRRITHKLFRPRIESKNVNSRRQSKDLDLDDVEQARRKGNDNTKKNKKPGQNDKNNDKKKKKNKKNKNRSRLEEETILARSAEEGPLLSSHEELFTAPAVFMGFSNLKRIEDVEVDLSGRFPRFVATVAISPLTVLLTDPTAPLKLSEVTTELTAHMRFTAKQARKLEKLKINEVTVEVPQNENVRILRSDLDLELDVISAAQNAVSNAIDTLRVARILHHELQAAFDEDNILQNLEDHPSLKA